MATTSVARYALDLSDARSVKAVEIAASAGQRIKARTADGTKPYGVPAQSEAGKYYLANGRECECPDSARRLLPCKHVLAVRLHCATVKAHRPRQQRRAPAPALASTVTDAALAAQRAHDAELAAKYVSIFGGDA